MLNDQPTAKARPTGEEELAARLPPQVKEQPDPMLQMSVGRSHAGGITLVALAVVIILGVVLYGLNSPAPNTQDVGTPPSASSAPAAGGHSGAASPTGQSAGNSGHS